MIPLLALLLLLGVGCASTGGGAERAGMDRSTPGAAEAAPAGQPGGGPGAAAERDEEPQEADEYADLYFDDEEADEYADLYFDDEEVVESDQGDPIEPFNRGVFAVNDTMDRFVLEPVATGFDWAVPDFAQRALRNGFDNLRFPIVFFNDLFQGKAVGAGQDLARFVVNSTVGLGGLMDPATKIGLPQRNEDFGQTLGYWGVPPGPFLMLPFFGPSNLRDTGGFVVDTAFRAIGFFIPFVASVAMQGIDTLNRRSLMREAIQSERRAALDWYAAVRSAYSQYRENLVRDKRRPTESAMFRDSYLDAEADEESADEPTSLGP